jgi:flagellar basal body-associated protein FliL
MKSLTIMLIIGLVILVIAGSNLSAFAFTEAYIPAAPFAEPFLMILFGTAFIVLGALVRRKFHK